MIERKAFKKSLKELLSHFKKLKFDCSPLVFERPAKEKEICAVEKELGYKIPAEFREILLNVSSNVEFWWQLPDDFELPEELDEIFSGELKWGLKYIKKLSLPDNFLNETFAEDEDEDIKIWYNKFVFQGVTNGDFVAIDLSEESYGKIVYLSHDGGEGHGYIMANSFNELLQNWLKLGFVGSEDWQWYPFTQSKTSGIDPRSKNALLWMKTIGLEKM